MFNVKSVSIAAIVLLLIAGIFDWVIGIPSWIYFFILIVHFIFIMWGSFTIRSNFYIKGKHYFSTSQNQIVLTFDDGPAPGSTEAILDILKLNKIKATFFCIGREVEKYPDIVKRIHEEGHSIGLHSFAHSYLYDFQFKFQMVADLRKNQSGIESIVGYKPKLFRPPYGVTTPSMNLAVKKMNLNMIGWSLRSLDTVIRDQNRVIQRILKRLKPGAILLLHDHLHSTPAMLTQLIQELKERNYEIVPLTDILPND